jgi:hypothetical protein
LERDWARHQDDKGNDANHWGVNCYRPVILTRVVEHPQVACAAICECSPWPGIPQSTREKRDLATMLPFRPATIPDNMVTRGCVH